MSPWPLNVFLSAPPVSRTLAAATFIFSVLVYTVLPFDLFHLPLSSLAQLPPQLWRIFTSLFITWPHLGIFFDTYFLYVYGGKLETGSPRFSQRADFFTYICFSYGVIMLLNLFIASGTFFAGPLGICFLTTFTREAWDQPVTFIILNMPAQYLPYAILFFTLIVCSPKFAVIEATGLVAAHLYDYLTGLYPNFGIQRNLITTPGWIKKCLAAWGLDLSWKRFGPGRTLGGEGVSVERQRPGGMALAAMIMGGFFVICLILGYFFMLHGGLNGWDWNFGFPKTSAAPLAVDNVAASKAIV